MLELIESSELEILNGKYGQDKEGEFTFVSRLGSSVIDLALVSKGIVENLKDFQIENRTESNHFPIKLSVKINRSGNSKSSNNNIVIHIVITYKWAEDKNIIFFRKDFKI